jgi:hypothetical protein
LAAKIVTAAKRERMILVADRHFHHGFVHHGFVNRGVVGRPVMGHGFVGQPLAASMAAWAAAATFIADL